MLIFPAASDRVVTMENPTRHLDIDDLKALIKNSPDGQLHLWVIFCEDLYETRFGDGFYSYPSRALQNSTLKGGRLCQRTGTVNEEGQGSVLTKKTRQLFYKMDELSNRGGGPNRNITTSAAAEFLIAPERS